MGYCSDGCCRKEKSVWYYSSESDISAKRETDCDMRRENFEVLWSQFRKSLVARIKTVQIYLETYRIFGNLEYWAPRKDQFTQNWVIKNYLSQKLSEPVLGPTIITDIWLLEWTIKLECTIFEIQRDHFQFLENHLNRSVIYFIQFEKQTFRNIATMSLLSVYQIDQVGTTSTKSIMVPTIQ